VILTEEETEDEKLGEKAAIRLSFARVSTANT